MKLKDDYGKKKRRTRGQLIVGKEVALKRKAHTTVLRILLANLLDKERVQF